MPVQQGAGAGRPGAHVSHGSETGGQRDCRVVSRIESDLGIGIFDRTQSVSLVELRRQVHVAIDKPRKDEFLAKIDKLTARRRIDEAARHRLDPLAFDKNALLRFGLYVWIGEQNASVNNLRLRGPSRIVCHGLFRPKLTIFCVTAPTDQRSPPKCLTILDPGAKPDNMIVGRETRSGIAAISGPGHAECPPGGRIAPLGLPENAPDVAGRNTAAARSLGQLATSFGGFFATCTAMYLCLAVSLWIILPMSALAAGFLVRIFIIQHHCCPVKPGSPARNGMILNGVLSI